MADEDRSRHDEVDDVPAFDLDAEGTEDLDELTREALESVAEVQAASQSAAQEREKGPTDVATLQAEIASLQDSRLRTLADLENLRKRNAREQQELRRFAAAELLSEFLEVVDNLERALESQGSFEDLKTGVGMILRQMQDLLRRHGVRDVAAMGMAFDPAVHDAVSREEDPTVTAQMVKEELKRGYLLHDRLLRPATVTVAVPTGNESDIE